MPTLMLKIACNPQFYNQEAFHNCTLMDLATTDLVELPTNPLAEEGLPSHMVVELGFMRFQNSHKLGPFDKKCWWTCHPVYDSWRNYCGDDEKIELEEVHLEPIFQLYKIINLNDDEIAWADCLVFPFQIRPYKTRIRSETFINSFMYHHETISSTYKGADWAFQTKTYWHTFSTCLHFQGYGIIRCSHFPPFTVLVHLTFLRIL